MAEEQWRIILESNMSGGGEEGAGGGGAGGAGSGGSAETPNQRKNLFEDAGKVFGAIASVSGLLAILIRSIGGSTVASTFMEVIFKILGALWDLFLINFLPVFMVLVRWLLSLMPVVKELGEALKPLIELIAEKLEGLLTAVTEWIIPRLLEFAKALTAFATTGDMSPLLAWGEKFFKDLFELASKLFMDMITWVKEKGPEIIESIGKSVTLFADWLQTNGPTIVNTIVSGIKIMQDTLDPLFRQLVAVLGPIFEQVFEPIKAKAIEVWEWSKKAIWEPIGDWFKWLFNTYVPALFKNMIDYIGQLIKIEIGIVGVLLRDQFAHIFDFSDRTDEINKLVQVYREQNQATMAQLPELQGINLKLEGLSGLLSYTSKTNELLTEQVTAQKEGNAIASGSYSSTGGQRISRYSWEGIGVHATSSSCGANESVAKTSNSAQTGKVELSQWAKTIYENMTGKQYV